MNAVACPSPAPPASAPQPPRLLDQVRQALQLRHYSPRTEEIFVEWIRRFVLFHDKRHPAQMAEPEVARFLSHLAVDGPCLALDAGPSPARPSFFSTAASSTGPSAASKTSSGPNLW